jgi:hypothetical protein
MLHYFRNPSTHTVQYAVPNARDAPFPPRTHATPCGTAVQTPQRVRNVQGAARNTPRARSACAVHS